MATAINVAGPSQEVEGRSAINADYWHEVREMLRRRHGKELMVLAWTGAGMAINRLGLCIAKMLKRGCDGLAGMTRLEELAGRIVRAWEDAFEAARQEIDVDPMLEHRVQTIELPVRLVTDSECTQARRQVEQLSKDAPSRLGCSGTKKWSIVTSNNSLVRQALPDGATRSAAG